MSYDFYSAKKKKDLSNTQTFYHLAYWIRDQIEEIWAMAETVYELKL